MAICFLKQDKAQDIVVKITGTVTYDDCQKRIIPELQNRFKDCADDEVNILVQLEQFDGCSDWKIVIDTVQQVPNCLPNEVKRVAVVGDASWEKMVYDFADSLSIPPANFKFFTLSEYPKAKKWMHRL